jgi:hypothetical protein
VSRVCVTEWVGEQVRRIAAAARRTATLYRLTPAPGVAVKANREWSNDFRTKPQRDRPELGPPANRQIRAAASDRFAC